MQIEMTLISRSGATPLLARVHSLVIAGWAGRDREAMEHHIRELEALGVKRPATTPTYYRVSASRLTTAPAIECSGAASSGEAEVMVLAQDGQLYVGLASDHTDRRVEAYGITVSKQMCDKPAAALLWPMAEVAGHWDQLILRSWLTEGGVRHLYQEGPVAGLLPPDDLIARYGADHLPDGTAMLCGTLPAIGGVRAGTRFDCELVDPVLSRRIELSYEVVELPIAG
jgi:hypothetical protein